MKLLVIDDHPMVISGCRSLFASRSSVNVEGAGDGATGYRAFLERRPDVTLIDNTLPDVSGFELMRQIRAEDPEAKIIMFSMTEDPVFTLRVTQAGAHGCLSKSDDPRLLVKAILKVAAGARYASPRLARSALPFGALPSTHKMTTRELEILSRLRQGSKLSEIADALDLSYKTVANATSLLKRKLRAKNHADLIRIAVERLG